MRHLICTLFIIACACVNKLYAQTPYDSFAPETSRPMLGIAETESQTDSILCAVVADMQNQMLLFVDVLNGEVIAYAPITDDVHKWLSVDPLADKYPNISPYAYAAWNPVKYVDPDGKEIINKMNPAANKTLSDAGDNILDLKANHIFFVSHASKTVMYPYGEEEMDAEGFVKYLSENSIVWNTTEDKSSVVIALIACETGKGENSIAQQISELIPEATIIAPTEEVKAADYEGRAYITGVAKKEATTLADTKKPENAGQWKAFRNGEVIGTSNKGNVDYIYKDENF